MASTTHLLMEGARMIDESNEAMSAGRDMKPSPPPNDLPASEFDGDTSINNPDDIC